MSLGSKVALVGSIAFTTGIITYVHKKQKKDLEVNISDQRYIIFKFIYILCVIAQRLHDGVIKDAERQEMRKIANLKHLQEQIDLTKALKAQRDKELETKS